MPNLFEAWDRRFHPEDRERTLAAERDDRAGLRAVYDMEFRMRHRDGSWRWIFARADFLREYASGFSQRTGIRVAVEMALFRVVQESLANVLRHSGSATALLRLATTGGAVTLEIADQGCGFALDARPPVPGVGMRGQIQAILATSDASLIDAEKRIIGCNHAELGACLLRHDG